MKVFTGPLMIAAALFFANLAAAGETPAPEGVKLYIISPADGATLKSPVHVVFGLSGMGVAPAGVEKENTGHHHLLVDAPLPQGEALNEAIAMDAQHLHFGGGQTEAKVKLAPGKHTLQLLLGDHNHIPHKAPVASEVVTIIVE
ncbi:MAG: DUF4399 domain-containing protein [Pseudomonadota bacterium]